MKRGGGGKIINIGSMISIFGARSLPRLRDLQGRDRAAHQERWRSAWARDNIQVNAMLPGWFDTELTQNARKQVHRSARARARAHARRPLGRGPTTSPGSRYFWRSPASDFVTGAAIPVDGGYSIQG